VGTNLLVTVLLYGLIGLAILVVLWPTERSGRQLLRSWSVKEPTAEQSRQAMRYLRDRRLLYPVLFFLAGLYDFRDIGWWSNWFVPIIAALLVAEVIGMVRRRSGVRVASLARRGWRDLVPLWAMILFLGLAAIGLGFAAAREWVVIPGIVVCLVLVLGLVALAVRRPADGDLQVDAALRTRSARVAVGIGIAWMTAMLALAAPVLVEVVGIVLFVVAIGGWIAVANPVRALPFVRAAG
jgi:hypothetical protein